MVHLQLGKYAEVFQRMLKVLFSADRHGNVPAGGRDSMDEAHQLGTADP